MKTLYKLVMVERTTSGENFTWFLQSDKSWDTMQDKQAKYTKNIADDIAQDIRYSNPKMNVEVVKA